MLEATKHEDDPSVVEDVKPNCGDCFGAGREGECCNSCEDLVHAYQHKHWNVDRILQTAPQVGQLFGVNA